MDLQFRYDVIKEIFENAASKKKDVTSRLLPNLVAWAIKFEAGKYDPPPSVTGMKIKMWEYDYLVSLFRSFDWRFLNPILPSIVGPASYSKTAYWDFDPPPSFTESRAIREIQIQKEQFSQELAIKEIKEKERKEMVRILAEQIKSKLTVDKGEEDKNVGMMVDGVLGGKQRGGALAGADSVYNALEYGSGPSYAAQQNILAQQQYNMQLANSQYQYISLYPSNSNKDQQIMQSMVEIAQVNTRKVFKKLEEATATKEPSVETNPLTTAPRMIEI